eukprot:8343930-Pyramimonas_sp.AAC.1
MGGYLGFSLDDLPEDGKEPNELPFTGFPETLYHAPVYKGGHMRAILISFRQEDCTSYCCGHVL